MPLALLHANVLALVPMSLGLGWANLLVAGAAGPPPPHPDLLALGLGRMPTSWDGLRRAYRAAARKGHPGMPMAAARKHSWRSPGRSRGWRAGLLDPRAA